MEGIRDLSGYFRALKKQLACPKPEQARFLARAKQMADDYRQGNPDAAEDETIDFLGPPEELASVFLESIAPDRLRQYRKRKMWLRRVGTALFIALFCIITIWWAYLKFCPIEVEVTETLIIYAEVEI